jgi:hypothetical protein
LAAVNRLAMDLGDLGAPERRTATDRPPLVAFREHLARDGEAATAGGAGTMLLRGANHAASYTTLVATELADCVRDAAKLMDRVAQLSRWTQEAAEQIDTDTPAEGPADAAVAEAAARKVTALAAQTSETTVEIEHTVSQLLCRTREYEEAVGRILGHVTAIHRSTRRLGRVLERTPTPQPDPAPPPAPAPEAGFAPEPPGRPDAHPVIARFPASPADEEPEPTPDQVADETAAAIAELIRSADEGAPTAAEEPTADPAAEDGTEDDPPSRLG